MLSVFGEHCSEIVIEKSRFLTYSSHVESEEEARDFLALVRMEHPMATHVCYAFVADKAGNLQRFSDDGEPSGTAGMPILDVIKRNKLFETCVAVVRYFGGIKLGAGGLVRAYASSAAKNLEEAEKRDYRLCRMLQIEIGYGEIDALKKYLARTDCDERGSEYLSSVVFSVAVKAEESLSFQRGLIDYLNGKAKISEKEEFFYPFPLAN
ncbi:MAG: YigZ family protein [Christensenellaceae bacterium]